MILDTSVYLDVLQARTPDAVDELLTYRVCYHSAVCLAELTHVFGRLDPAHPSTSGVLQTVRDVIEDIPLHRLQAPDSATWGEAGMLAGELFRLSARRRVRVMSGNTSTMRSSIFRRGVSVPAY